MTERRIVDYTIIEHARPAPYFVADVLAAIKSGWELFGPPHILENVVGQPMVRYAEPEPALGDDLAWLAFELASGVTKAPGQTTAYWTEIYDFCDKILAIKAKRKGGEG
jgi:hypothetical protein